MNQYTKYIIFILPLLCLGKLTAQNTASEPYFYKEFTRYELNTKKLINDKIYVDGKVLYLDIKIEEGNLEYFRIDNYSYYAREKENDILKEEGTYELNPLEIISTDTFVSFDPETYEETLEVINYYHLVKNGKWSETNDKGDIWTGNYINGLKEGQWMSLLNHGYKTHKFKADILDGIYNPSKDSIEAHLELVLDKELIWSKRINYVIAEGGEVYKLEWAFEMVPEFKSLDLGKFIFKRDGTFIFDESMNEIKKGIRAEGKGKWSINEKSELTLEFSDGKKDTMTINYWGNGYLGLDNSID